MTISPTVPVTRPHRRTALPRTLVVAGVGDRWYTRRHDRDRQRQGLLDPATAERVQLDRWLPSDDAAVVIERFWTLHFDVSSPQVQPLLPHPCVNVAFGTADPGVHGPPKRRDDHRIAGRGWVLGAKLRPGALVALGLGNGPRLVDSVAPIGAVFGHRGRHIAEAVGAEPDLRRCSRFVEELMMQYLPIADETWGEFIDVIAMILADRSLVRVGQVARLSGWSARTLQRWFGHYLRLSPAWVLARYRLQDAADVLARGEHRDLSQLAADLGYCGQAHFTRAFTGAVGMPPGGYVRWCRDRMARPQTALAG